MKLARVHRVLLRRLDWLATQAAANPRNHTLSDQRDALRLMIVCHFGGARTALAMIRATTALPAGTGMLPQHERTADAEPQP